MRFVSSSGIGGKTTRLFKAIVIFPLLFLFGCTNLHQRLALIYSGQAPEAQSFQFQDGETSLYYSFTVNDAAAADRTLVFFYGGSGCTSWKYVMPDYVSGVTVPARIFVLNKRFVTDRSTGMFGCGTRFLLANNPNQWVADYSAFIVAHLQSLPIKPTNVVLVGVSEGGLVAAQVANLIPDVTHLALIGSGGFTMRKMLSTLAKKGMPWDIDAGWKMIATDPRSVEKSWFGNPYRWWSDVLDVDPLPIYLQLNIPILAGMGEQDQSVPIESARFLQEQFRAAGKTNLTLKVYPGADHRLRGNGMSYRDDFFSELSRQMQ